jgi:hypothetical protein
VMTFLRTGLAYRFNSSHHARIGDQAAVARAN